MCESLILPIFNYCNILYYPCLDQTAKNRLQIVQDTCCRFIFNLRKYDHISEKYVELRWLRMDNIVKLHFLIFLYRLFHSSAPPYLRKKLIFRNVVHNRNIRHQYTLTMPHHSTAFFQRCFTYFAIMLYNFVKPNMCLSLCVFRRQKSKANFSPVKFLILCEYPYFCYNFCHFNDNLLYNIIFDAYNTVDRL